MVEAENKEGETENGEGAGGDKAAGGDNSATQATGGDNTDTQAAGRKIIMSHKECVWMQQVSLRFFSSIAEL